MRCWSRPPSPVPRPVAPKLPLRILLLCVLLVAPAAHASAFDLAASPAEAAPTARAGLDPTVATFSDAAQAQREESRWAIERIDAQRRRLQEEERTLTDAAIGNRRSPALAAALTEALTTARELDSVLGASLELQEQLVATWTDGIAELRQLRARPRIADVLPAEPTSADVAALIEELEQELAALHAERARGEERVAALTEALQGDRADLDTLRATLFDLRLDALDPPLGPQPPEGDADSAELLRLTERSSALRVRLAERRATNTRLQLDDARVRLELIGGILPVLAGRLDAAEERRRELAQYESGGILAQSPLPLSAASLGTLSAWLAAEASELPATATRTVLEPLKRALLRPEVLVTALLALLLQVLGIPRLRRRLAAEPDAQPGLVAATIGPTLLLVPAALWLSFLARHCAPELQALLLAVAWVPVSLLGGVALARRSLGSSAEHSDGTMPLVRGAAAATGVLGLTWPLGRLLSVPHEFFAVLELSLLAVLAVSGLRLLPRRERIAARLESQLGSKLPTNLREVLQLTLFLLAFTPVGLAGVLALGYRNLAGFVVEGGAVTAAVILLTPSIVRSLQDALARAVGFPEGGGRFGLGPRASRRAYQVGTPIVLVVVGLLATLLVAAAWGKSGLLTTLGQMLSSPVVSVGGSDITPARLAALAGTLLGTLLVNRWVLSFARRRIYPVYSLDGGMAASIDTVTRYVILLVGFLVGLDVVGVGLGVLTVFAGVIGIGIGFGGQKLAANFISGLLLLVTRPVAVGDTIEVSGITGKVVRISSYATAVRTLENLTVIVPNSAIVDESVVNWTIDEPRVRLPVPVGVAYGSEVRKVEAALLSVGKNDPGVLTNPGPEVRFEDFGDSSLLFMLMVWIDEPLERKRIASRLRFAIDDRFRQEGIEIAFPQLDIHVRKGDGVLAIGAEKGWAVEPPE